MKNLVAYFIKYPITGNVLMVAILILGVIGLSSLRSTFFPENDASIISIQVIYPGASPEEVEEGVVNKIEDAIKSLTGIDRVTSVSSENTGRVTVEAATGYDIDELLRDVKNSVDGISSFPVDIEPPVIYIQEVLNIAFQFIISGDVSLKKLKETAREVESDLLALDGISKITLSGFPDEEIEIALRENDLRSLNLTFDQVRAAVSAQNIDLTGGTIKGDNGEVLIRTRSKEYFAEGLKDIVVAQSPDGRKILLREIASVTDKWADTPNRTYLNGKSAVKINVQNTTDESLIGIAETVNTYVEQFNDENDVLEATVIQDGSILLNQRIALLEKNGVIGFILVIVLLAMFLRPSLAFWVAVAIPVSFAGTFLVGSIIGLQINVISLFGLILVLGILVDDGVVISENIYQHWERGKTPFQAAVDGTMEVLPAVFGAILTTVIAFSTFFFLDGVTGDFFADIALVVALSLSFSLVEGAFILPGHISHSAALRNRENESTSPFARFFKTVQNNLNEVMEFMKEKLYAPQLKVIMQYPILGVTVPIAFLIMSFGLPASGLMKITFFPVVEGDVATVNLQMPAGTPEVITKQYLDRIEKGIWAVNEELKGERADGEDVILIVNQSLQSNSYTASILVRLMDSEQRQEHKPHASSLGILNRVEKEVGKINEAELLTYQLGSPFGKPVNIALYSDNLSQLSTVVNAVKDSLEEFPELINIESSDQEGLREINVTLKEKARLLGLDLNTVVRQVRAGFFGAEVQRLQRGEDEVKVWVRYDENERKSIGQLENMYIRTQAGQTFPLSEIANLEPTRGLISINHLDGEREIRIEADAANSKVSTQDVLARIQNSVVPNVLKNYPDVGVSYEGQARENTKFFGSISKVGPVILFMMLLMIILTFRSVSQSLALIAIIPFSLIGVFWGHYLLGFAFSVILSGLGVLALIGILVNDGLVLISQYNLLVKNGKPYKEALYEASLSRFRPIFLTSVTTIAGLGPLILEKSLQAQFLIPMAITVAFGLAVATLLILVMLPALLILFNWLKYAIVYLASGDVDRTTLEPAYEGEETHFIVGLVRGLIVAIFMALIAYSLLS
ncbi:MAG: efflux RND transporter permease subunit [Bacteroidia bacterium]|nr:efflux RND transporter permease subunit [Bacteroidia bacterium]